MRIYLGVQRESRRVYVTAANDAVGAAIRDELERPAWTSYHFDDELREVSPQEPAGGPVYSIRDVPDLTSLRQRLAEEGIAFAECPDVVCPGLIFYNDAGDPEPCSHCGKSIAEGENASDAVDTAGEGATEEN